MAFVHGKDTTVLYDASDLSQFFTDINSSRTVETNQCTAFGASSHSYIVGLQDGTASASGYLDLTASTGVDVILQATLGDQSSDAVSDGHLMILNKTQAVSDNVQIMRCDTTNYSITTPVADVASISADFQSSEGIKAAQLLNISTADRTPADSGGTYLSSAIDVGGASSSTGAIAQLHVVTNAIAATTVIKIRHSASSSGTYADLVTFSTVGSTATVSERKSVATGSTINRYMKVQAVTSGSNAINFALAIARL